MYEVKRPVYTKTTERYIGREFPEGSFIHRVTGWETLGVVRDMAEAVAKFPRCKANGYSPILEEIKVH